MISLKNVSKIYENGTVALDDISFTLEDGEIAFLVGPSGSGKTTIIKLLTGEVAASEGEVTVNEYDMCRIKHRKMPYLRRTIGVVFQDFRLIPSKTVFENVAFAMRATGAKGKDIKKRVPEVLTLVGLEEKSGDLPTQISGGEQQRVAIARALVNKPSLIIADEPTGNLDPVKSLEIMKLLQEINELGTTVLIVTHEKELVNQFSKRVIAIDNGKVISDGMDGYYNYD